LEYIPEKLVERLLVYSGAKTHQQDIRRVHTNIWLGGQVFGKTMSREEPGDHLAIAEARHAQSFIIPVPGETQTNHKILFQGLKFKRKGEQLMRDTQFAKVGADLNRDLVGVTDVLPPGIQRREGRLSNYLARSGIGQCQPVFWLAGKVKQQLMLAFGKTREGAQPFIRSQPFYKRGLAATPQK